MRELVRLEVEVMFTLEWSLWYEMSEVEEVCRALLELGEEMEVVERVEWVEERVEEEEQVALDPLPDAPPLLPFDDTPPRHSLEPPIIRLPRDPGSDDEDEDDERREPEWRRVLAAAEGATTFREPIRKVPGRTLGGKGSYDTVRAGVEQGEEKGEPVEVC